ncbi:MAG: CDP-glycerol glycerophosphotransferase family protein [Candidatus Electryonea clarkiae]|nr:CDP-glycerol glycerophosphotransferase family protein [Candidatus Electryonea clarkiae]
MKIGILAYSSYYLKKYWEQLRDKTGCWWGVTQPALYDELKEMGAENIVCCTDLLNYRPEKEGLKYVSVDRGRAENELAEKINPDLWISDHLNRLSFIPKKVPWVETFHGFGFKKHIQLHREIIKYDLILLPGEWHKQSILSKYPWIPDECLKIVGWPAVDDFFQGKFDREEILLSFGLDPNRKTVMYAPTWGGYHGEHKLFGRWFGLESEVFELLCSEVKRMGLNFIVKLHSLSPYAGDQKLQKIARSYGALWAVKETSTFQTDPNPYLWATDLLISDLSAIIMDFIVLDRPIIYIDPDDTLDAWEEASMPPDLRVGYVVKTPEELVFAIEDCIKYPERFKKERQDVISKVFYCLDGNAASRAATAILDFAKERGMS